MIDFVDVPLISPNCQRIQEWDGKTWRLLDSWRIRFKTDEYCYELMLPKGFVTDFGSIPRAFRRLWTPMGPYLVGYLTHDGLYGGELVARAEADYILCSLLEDFGANWVDRNAQYSGVRAGGWLVWSEHKAEEVAAIRESCVFYRGALA